MTPKRKLIHNQKLIQILLALTWIIPIYTSYLLAFLTCINPTFPSIAIVSLIIATILYTPIYITQQINKHKNPDHTIQ